MATPFAGIPFELPSRTKPHQVWVYGLLDPRDDTLRYVGQSRYPEQRLRDHIASPELGTCANHDLEVWLDDLARLGLRPTMRILEETDSEHWETAERWWIAWARRRGRVYNIEDGGIPKRFRRAQTKPKPKPTHRQKPGYMGKNGVPVQGKWVKVKPKKRRRR